MADRLDHATTQIVHSDHASQLPKSAEPDYLFVMSEKPRRIRRPAAPRIAFDAPPYLIEQIKQRALKQRCTIRTFMIDLLAAQGFEVKEEDRVADRRLLNPGRPAKTRQAA